MLLALWRVALLQVSVIRRLKVIPARVVSRMRRQLALARSVNHMTLKTVSVERARALIITAATVVPSTRRTQLRGICCCGGRYSPMSRSAVPPYAHH